MNCIHRPAVNQRTWYRATTRKALTISLLMSFCVTVHALPTGGVVTAGNASISSSPTSTTITQSTPNAVINWQGFNVGPAQAVQFVQPGSGSVTLNRVVGPDPSSILGSITANGKVFLVNPNGILFGSGASINVGGLVASTLNISDSDFMKGSYKFTGAGNGALNNDGSINADAGYVALLGRNVSNNGVISARLGTIALAAGTAVTLDISGDKLLNVNVDQGAINALVQNGGLIKADGGRVLMTTQTAEGLFTTAVNNSGVIEAQTIQNHSGTITLLGDMQNGVTNVGGTLDASAPNGGNGGFIETSAAHVKIAGNANITTAAPSGLTGTWLIDPQDFNIAATGGDISGATLSNLLVTNSVIISTNTGSTAAVAGTPPVTSLYAATAGNGDIFVNDAVSWTASSSPTTLTLNAARDVNVNRAVTAVNGNFVVCCGRDVNVKAAITTTNGSVLLSAGRNANIDAAMTTTDGNIMICAAQDVNVSGAITLTRGSSIPSQSLGLPLGLVLNSGYGGTGPGSAGGTVTFASGTPPVAVTGPNAPVTIYYNPVSYTSPTDYSTHFTLTNGATLTQKMLVFPDGADRAYDGTTTATFSSLKGNPAGVTLIQGPGSTATFDTASVGTDKTITFNGYSLGGVNAGNFALAISCCSPQLGRTTANITAGTVPPGSTVLPNGSTVLPSGIVVLPGGVVVLPSGQPVSPGEMLGVIPVIAPLSTLPFRPSVLPTVTLTETPPQLLTLVQTPEHPSIYVPLYPKRRRYLN
ncbi:filamentous hemagglutinin N-terminal domain-containing protein [Paralcaligenes sp. KSB-10]|uniref:two-partner secretion domain-containing protein n=1 Tax=Paralcaligenes sp. KSB-10 TaxID=2901142 RepID=UPI001E55C326|nr:filamentous hemagglutinin N-terminal domain-containing protein [Paralcaligenes sp. KSB-10]UHL66138.1 filamentous hemagglutinin N-terminal domain-containing protein [Paralcaligenes sp. KSB-10]